MTTLREEIAKHLWQIYIRNEYGIGEYKDEYKYEYSVHNWNDYTDRDKQGYLGEADGILKLFEKRIDKIIEIDTKIVNKERGTKEGKIAAQASKNTLILFKEMLNQK